MTLKLLLVGKELSYFQPIKDAFENEDANIIVATSIGLALFLARKNLPNLVISQDKLIDSDGLSLFYELQEEAQLSQIPFILLTDKILENETNKTDIGQNNIFLWSSKE